MGVPKHYSAHAVQTLYASLRREAGVSGRATRSTSSACRFLQLPRGDITLVEAYALAEPRARPLCIAQALGQVWIPETCLRLSGQAGHLAREALLAAMEELGKPFRDREPTRQPIAEIARLIAHRAGRGCDLLAVLLDGDVASLMQALEASRQRRILCTDWLRRTWLQ